MNRIYFIKEHCSVLQTLANFEPYSN